MSEKLKRGLLKALFQFRKTGLSITSYLVNEMHSDLNITEISVLKCVKEYGEKGCSGKNSEYECTTAHDAMQSILSVSKAAISQTLGCLEKKGYIERGIDRNNRRKIIITITETGAAAFEKSTDALDKLLVSLMNQFGEAKASKLIALINSFAGLVEALDKETARCRIAPEIPQAK